MYCQGIVYQRLHYLSSNYTVSANKVPSITIANADDDLVECIDLFCSCRRSFATANRLRMRGVSQCRLHHQGKCEEEAFSLQSLGFHRFIIPASPHQARCLSGRFSKKKQKLLLLRHNHLNFTAEFFPLYGIIWSLAAWNDSG